MLELFTRHGGFDLTLKANGDLDVDQHHTVEDVGIVLGEAVLAALGDRKGINRAGYFVMPMDETLAVVAIDLGGRPHAKVDLKVKVRMVGDLQSELVPTSSTASPSAPAPTCTPRCCTVDRATTTSRRCSRRSRAHCAWRAPRTRGWRRCCRAPRACCGAGDRARRLRRRQPDVGAQGVQHAGRARSSRRATPAECARRGGDHRAGRRPLRRDGGARCPVARRDSPPPCAQGTPLLGICVGMQWLFEGSDEAPGRAAASACCRAGSTGSTATPRSG